MGQIEIPRPDSQQVGAAGELRASQAVGFGIVGAWLYVCLEFLFVITLKREAFTGLWEVRSGFVGLLPVWWLLALPVGGLFGFLGWCLGRMTLGQMSRGRLALSLFALVFGVLVAWGVGGGRHLASFSSRGGFALAVGVSGGAVVYFGVERLVRFLQRFSRPLQLRLLNAACLSLSLSFALLNALMLRRLYPAFHGGLSVLSVGTFAFGSQLVLPSLLTRFLGQFREESPKSEQRGRGRQGRGLLVVVTSVAIACAVFALPGSRSVQGFDNLRYVVSETSPTLAIGVNAAARLAPPPSLDSSLLGQPLGARKRRAGVDLRGRDILLISVDALRADHLGSYGYGRKISPAIDSLSKEGVVFEAAYAATPHTSYSVTSLMTGKYMRPLLLQDAGRDSALLAEVLRTYGYRTGGFYPPAVFFIDPGRFERFERERLGFEFSKVEFAEGALRSSQVENYLREVPKELPAFTWVHLFGPHEPYERHPGESLGEREIDLYDGEIREADRTIARVVELARKRDPEVLIVITADHGEEFGEHGGRYHGTTVYEEQVRVPLIVVGARVARGLRITDPVQTIDLFPTILEGLQIPIPPRIRGKSLLGYLDPTAKEPDSKAPVPKAKGSLGHPSETGLAGQAVAETDDYTLLAEGAFRLICHRPTGACQLFHLPTDPRQTADASGKYPEVVARMKETARALAGTHGRFESEGLRAEGSGFPPAIVQGISGNADVAPELGRLLDDASVLIRRKAAELLFSLGTEAQAPALRLAMSREEDEVTREWIALSLTSLGQGAPLVREMLTSGRKETRRFAALALAEQGDSLGEKILIDWWTDRKELDHAFSKRLLFALGKIRAEDAVPYLVASLGDVRLRPLIATTLAETGDKDARPHLAAYLMKERYKSNRIPLANAILALGGDMELVVPLRHFLGVPDRLEGGVGLALEAGILEDVGGPNGRDLTALQQLSDSGVPLSLVVAPGGQADAKIRLIIRYRTTLERPSPVLLQPGKPRMSLKKGAISFRNQPEFDGESSLKIALEGEPSAPAEWPPGKGWKETAVTLPDFFGAKAGHTLNLELFAPQNVEILAVVAVPLREDLPPPPPEPWKASDAGKKDGSESSQ